MDENPSTADNNNELSVSELLEKMFQEIVSQRIHKDLTLMINPQDAPPRIDTGTLHSNFFVGRGDFKLMESKFVDRGTAYLVNNNPPRSFKMRGGLQGDLSTRLRHELNNIILNHSYGRMSSTKPEYRWQRQHRESIIAWGDRLQERGLLDNHEIRWEYQKAVWGGAIHTAKAIFVQIADRVITVFKLSRGE